MQQPDPATLLRQTHAQYNNCEANLRGHGCAYWPLSGGAEDIEANEVPGMGFFTEQERDSGGQASSLASG